MHKRSSTSKKALRFVFYGAAAVVGVLLAVSTAKKKGKLIQKGGEKLIKKTKLAVKSAKDKLNKRQRNILKLFEKEEKITNEMIRTVVTKVSERTIRRDLNYLERKGYIEQVGKTKGSYYILK